MSKKILFTIVLLLCLFGMMPTTVFATEVSPTTWTSETKNDIYATVTITDWKTREFDLEVETPVDNMTSTEIFATIQFHGTPQDNCVYTADILHDGQLFMRAILDASFPIEAGPDGEGANKMMRTFEQGITHKIGAADIRLSFDFSVVVTGTVGSVRPIDGGTHTIVAGASEGGEITPSGEISVPNGATQAFAITAASDYQIGDVLVDGISVGAVSEYIFENVNDSHTIDVSFIASSGGNNSMALGIGGSGVSGNNSGGWTATHTVVVASVAIVAVAGVTSTALIVRARRKK